MAGLRSWTSPRSSAFLCSGGGEGFRVFRVFRDLGFGSFRVYRGLGFRVFRVYRGLGFRGFRVLGLRVYRVGGGGL